MIKKIIYILVVLGAFPGMVAGAQDVDSSLYTIAAANEGSPLYTLVATNVERPLNPPVGDYIVLNENNLDEVKDIILREHTICRAEILGKDAVTGTNSLLNPPEGDFSRIITEINQEEAASKRVWNESFEADLENNNEHIYAINSYYSVKLIEKINEKKAVFKRILFNIVSQQNITAYDRQLLLQFKKYATASINALTGEENDLIIKISNKNQQTDYVTADKFSPNRHHSGENLHVLFPVNTALPGGNNNLNQNKQYKVKSTINAIGKDLHNVNLNIYSIKTNKADIFRLFLYIWEDNEGAAHVNKISVPSFCVKRTFPGLDVRTTNADSPLFTARVLNAGSPLNPAPFVKKVPGEIKQNLQYKIKNNNSTFYYKRCWVNPLRQAQCIAPEGDFSFFCYSFFEYKIINHFKIINRSEKINYCIMPSPPTPLPEKWKGEGSIRRVFYVL